MPSTFNFDPAMFAGTSSAVFVLLTVGWFLRKDINTRNQLDREDRARERQESSAERTETQRLHKESITELKTSISEMVASHQAVVARVIAKAEETERLSEGRYSLLLTQTLKSKSQPTDS